MTEHYGRCCGNCRYLLRDRPMSGWCEFHSNDTTVTNACDAFAADSLRTPHIPLGIRTDTLFVTLTPGIA
jgi:hypothetical protein